MLLIVMSSKQKSVSIDEDQKIEILKYMKINGIKYFSTGIYSLIHKGLNCRCSNGNNGGGVQKNQNVSSGKKTPVCFGNPGDGDCQICDINLKSKCAMEFANNGSKSTTKNNPM
jgi:hypothetical protein